MPRPPAKERITNVMRMASGSISSRRPSPPATPAIMRSELERTQRRSSSRGGCGGGCSSVGGVGGGEVMAVHSAAPGPRPHHPELPYQGDPEDVRLAG